MPPQDRGARLHRLLPEGPGCLVFRGQDTKDNLSMPWPFRSRSTATATLSRAPEPSAQKGRRSGRRFTFLGGRRMIADAPYVLPKDLGEINRLDFQHYLYRAALKSNYAAPIGSPQSILDVGTGSGRWAIEIAEQFPLASVIALDLVDPAEIGSRSHLPERFPSNYAFVQGDILRGLPFAEQSFDFVHQRLLYAAIPQARWQWVVYELSRVTRPGGWVELVEGGTLRGDGPNGQAVNGWAVQMCDLRGINVRIGPQLDHYLREAQLEDVQLREIVLPVGRAYGHLGRLAETNLVHVYQSLRGAVIASGIVDAATYDRALAAMPDEFARWPHTFPFYVAYGRRP
jgi:ubiquinone/menaquinone biosynthesis C-methylase UbiE